MTSIISNRVRHVGFAAGQQLMQLGTVPDVKLFFSCIPHVAVDHQDKSWDVLFDRLYRRYLRPEEFSQAVALMGVVKTWFFAQPSDFVDWSRMLPGQSTLEPKGKSLGQVFVKFFAFFEMSVADAQYQVDTVGFGALASVVRLVMSDMGDFIKYDQERPLADYDALARNAAPFWSLPYEELEKYKA